MGTIWDFFKEFRSRNGSDERGDILTEEKFLPIHKTSLNDVFIAGYPKSGNTWMQNLIAGLLFGIDGHYLPDQLTQELVPDVHSKKVYKKFYKSTFFKTHELPKSHMKRVIHLVRDGRDVMASYYAMNKAVGINCTLEEMIIHGQHLYISTWAQHTREWIRNPYSAEILVVKYEDLLKDTFNQLQRILEFTDINRPDDLINRTICGNNFSEMKRKEKEFGWKEEWRPRGEFIRLGKIGSYKEEIPLDLIRHFEKNCHTELKYFSYI